MTRANGGTWWFLAFSPIAASALTIEIDYRYDTEEFFGTDAAPHVAARAALEAAAGRYEEILAQSLDAVNLVDDSLDARIQFTHPGTGALIDVSCAVSVATDALAAVGAGPAGEYRGPWSIPADTIVIYAGGHAMGVEARASSGAGLNFATVFDDPGSHVNRSFNSGIYSMPMWGGSLAFTTVGVTWHFDLATAAPPGTRDCYTFALHEIGHILGLATAWDDMANHISGSNFTGTETLANYNRDNGTSLTGLTLVDSSYNPAGGVVGDFHFQNNSYQSFIYAAGTPRYAGTAGPDAPQDLLMDEFLGFTAALRSFEVTNTDVGALLDLGWNVVCPPPAEPVAITSVQRAPDGSATITWASEPGRNYTVRTSLDGRSWSDVTPPVPSAGTATSWVDGEAGYSDPTPPAATQPAKLYRVRAAK